MINTKLVYLFLILLINVSCSNITHKEQSDALLQFKQNISSSNRSDHLSYQKYSYCDDLLGSDYRPLSMNWNTSIDCCHWIGVTCNKFNDVISLNLICGMLQGVLELDTLLSSLPNLEVLDLSYNNFSVVTNNATNYINPNFRVLRLASCKLSKFPELSRAMKNLEILDLSRNKIRGQIPDWAGEIGGNRLRYIDLSYNYITSVSEFRSDALEYLFLQSNVIQEQFPLMICNMKHLKQLDISDNSFSGMVPLCLENISSALLSLNVGSNMLQGPFPPSICNMGNLLYLDLSKNWFSGVIPPCFGNIISSLSMTNLSKNTFHGAIPNIFRECGLTALHLNQNQLEGEVPRSLSECRSLQVLNLGHNKLDGAFPRWLGDFPKLQVLVLRSNKLHGTIETSYTMGFPFPSVKVFDISDNGFVGRLPGLYFENFNAIKDVEKGGKPEYVNVSSLYYTINVPDKGFQTSSVPLVLVMIIYVDLSSNGFEGDIPEVIGSLKSLMGLNLSHNNLNGQIPYALGNLEHLQVLDLSSNQLTREIPQSLVNLTFLQLINFWQNHLEGSIPEGKQFYTFGRDSYGGNLGLCGPPLTEHCKDPKVEADESEFPWKVVMTGFGCGTLLGLLMGYRMLTTGKPRWFNAIVEHIIPPRPNKRRYIYIGK